MRNNLLTRISLLLFLFAAATICLWEIYTFPFASVDLRLLILYLFTILAGKRLTVSLPNIRGSISATSTFIFLVFLIYGGNAAVLLAAAEGLSRYITSKRQLLFQAAVVTISTFLTASLMELLFGSPFIGYSPAVMVEICMMAYCQSAAESGLMRVGNTLIFDENRAETWQQYYLYLTAMHFANAFVAGVCVFLIDAFGFYGFAAMVPFVISLYFAYRTTLTKISISDEQARLAMRRVDELNRYIAGMRETSSQSRHQKPLDKISIGEDSVVHSKNSVKGCSLVQEATDSPRHLRVFLCHCSDDKPAVRGLYRKLIEEGVNVWFDEERLLPGQDWEHEISGAVRKSDLVIVCLSTRSISKAGYGQKEIKFALDIADQQPEGSIFIVPLKLENCDVPDRLRRWQWVNLFENGGYERLVSALNYSAGILSSRAAITLRP